MLPGLSWLGAFETKSVCPQTWVADLELGGKDNTRLLPESAINTTPLASTFTSRGVASAFGDVFGAASAFAVVDEKSGWPSTFLAAAPVAPVEKTSTRLSAGLATYTFPLESTATPAGPAMVEAEAGPAPLV